MASGKHTTGRHSAAKSSKREVSIPRGPADPRVGEETGVPEEIAKTAAGKMQTADPARDERPSGEAATGESLDEWVEQREGQGDPAGKTARQKAPARKRVRRRAAAFAAVLAIIVLAVVALAVYARPAPTPAQVTQTALEALQSRDFSAFGEVYAGDSDALESQLADAFASGAGLGSASELERKLNDEQKSTLAQLDDLLFDFGYTVGEETVDGDEARVQVTVTAHDFGAFAQKALGDYISEGLAAAAKGDLESSADAATRFARVLQENMDVLGPRDKQSETSFELTRDGDGSWKLAGLTADNLDALTGGLLSMTGQMAAQLESASSE